MSSDRNRKLAFKQTDDCVKLMTMHSSKGLESPVVIVAGVGRLGREAERVAEDAKLLYVAMTRSTERLLVTGDRESDFLTALQAADGYVHTSSDAG